MSAPGTCPGGLPATPLPVDNPPGLPALRARIGGFASFRRTMLERIAAQPGLAALTTRAPDDHAITLLEQWAALGDVLTFHQERYVNENFLGTAVLDESVHRLVELIGYRPRPGVSATTTLALTLAAGAALTVSAGFPVQSVPGPGEQPQIFETLEGCAADWRLNALPAYGKPTAVDPLTRTGGALVHPADAPRWAGVLRPGDPMLVVVEGPGAMHVKIGSGTRDVGSVLRTTVAALDAGPDGLRLRLAAQAPSSGAAAYRPAKSLLVNGHDAPDTGPPVMHKNDDKITWDVGTAVTVTIEAGKPLPLERKNESLAVGTPLLVVDPGAFTRVVRVKETAPGTETLLGSAGPTVQVALVTVKPDLPEIADRRKLQVVQLDGEPSGGSAWTTRTDSATSSGSPGWPWPPSSRPPPGPRPTRGRRPTPYRCSARPAPTGPRRPSSHPPTCPGAGGWGSRRPADGPSAPPSRAPSGWNRPRRTRPPRASGPATPATWWCRSPRSPRTPPRWTPPPPRCWATPRPRATASPSRTRCSAPVTPRPPSSASPSPTARWPGCPRPRPRAPSPR